MKTRRLRFLLATPAFAFSLAACSSDETMGGHGAAETVMLFHTSTTPTVTTSAGS